MGIAYRNDDPPGLSVAVWDGVVTEAEIVAFIDRVRADPDYLAGRRLLSDLSTLDPASAPTAEQRARYAERYRGDGRLQETRWAAVAHGVFRSVTDFGTLLGVEVMTFIVFNDAGSAALWLGVSERDAQRVVRELRAELRGGKSAGG